MIDFSHLEKYRENNRIEAKKALLTEYEITYDELPKWQRSGVNLEWVAVEKEGWNPISNSAVKTTRKELKHDLELPEKRGI